LPNKLAVHHNRMKQAELGDARGETPHVAHASPVPFTDLDGGNLHRLVDAPQRGYGGCQDASLMPLAASVLRFLRLPATRPYSGGIVSAQKAPERH
jgi:hypothetical protein